MIENRHAYFERGEHAHAVHFRENVFDQIRLSVHVEHLADGVTRWSRVEQSEQNVLRVSAFGNSCAELRREQRHVALEYGNQANFVSIALPPRKRQVVRELAAAHSFRQKRKQAFAINTPEALRKQR